MGGAHRTYVNGTVMLLFLRLFRGHPIGAAGLNLTLMFWKLFATNRGGSI